MRAYLRPRTIEEAYEIQLVLKKKLKIRPLRKTLRYVAAADAAFNERDVYAAATLFRIDRLEHLQDVFVRERVRFPYVPGLLAFREGHAIINALRKLKMIPDLILVDGQGIAHPRGFGIASQVGVLFGIPTVGCAKSRLVGEYEEPGPMMGEWSYLTYRGEKVGAVVRTRSLVKPVFVSPGHLADIESSVEIVLRCVYRYRIPEPLRFADVLSKKLKREYSKSPELDK